MCVYVAGQKNIFYGFRAPRDDFLVVPSHPASFFLESPVLSRVSSFRVPSRPVSRAFVSHPVPCLELSCPVPFIPSRLILLREPNSSSLKYSWKKIQKISRLLVSSVQIIYFTIHLFQSNIYTSYFIANEMIFLSLKYFSRLGNRPKILSNVRKPKQVSEAV